MPTCKVTVEYNAPLPSDPEGDKFPGSKQVNIPLPFGAELTSCTLYFNGQPVFTQPLPIPAPPPEG